MCFRKECDTRAQIEGGKGWIRGHKKTIPVEGRTWYNQKRTVKGDDTEWKRR